MGRYTNARLVKSLAYFEKQVDRLTDLLADPLPAAERKSIEAELSRYLRQRAHAIDLVQRRACCRECGRKITDPLSLEAWEKDLLGPECRRRAQRRAS